MFVIGVIVIGFVFFICFKFGGEIDVDLNWVVINSLCDLVDIYYLFDLDVGWFVLIVWIFVLLLMLLVVVVLVWIFFCKFVIGCIVYVIGLVEGVVYMLGLLINWVKIVVFVLVGFFVFCGGFYLVI